MRRRAAERGTAARAILHRAPRSEEHTSELQSRLHLVCRLLLEKNINHARRRCFSLSIRHEKKLLKVRVIDSRSDPSADIKTWMRNPLYAATMLSSAVGPL